MTGIINEDGLMTGIIIINDGHYYQWRVVLLMTGIINEDGLMTVLSLMTGIIIIINDGYYY